MVSHLATLPAGKVVSRTSLADSLSLPADFLAKILRKLSGAGIIVSYKGAGGGYRLALAPDQIPLATVVEAIDGKSHLVECLAGISPECQRINFCQPFLGCLREVEERIQAILKDVNIQELSQGMPASAGGRL